MDSVTVDGGARTPISTGCRAPREYSMTLQRRELYRSAPNGDRWSLVREPASERVFIEHEPNASSGGQTTHIEIGDFLVGGGHGPEHQALVGGALLGQEGAGSGEAVRGGQQENPTPPGTPQDPREPQRTPPVEEPP